MVEAGVSSHPPGEATPWVGACLRGDPGDEGLENPRGPQVQVATRHGFAGSWVPTTTPSQGAGFTCISFMVQVPRSPQCIFFNCLFIHFAHFCDGFAYSSCLWGKLTLWDRFLSSPRPHSYFMWFEFLYDPPPAILPSMALGSYITVKDLYYVHQDFNCKNSHF